MQIANSEMVVDKERYGLHGMQMVGRRCCGPLAFTACLKFFGLSRVRKHGVEMLSDSLQQQSFRFCVSEIFFSGVLSALVERVNEVERKVRWFGLGCPLTPLQEPVAAVSYTHLTLPTKA